MEDFTGLVPQSWVDGLQQASTLALQGVQTYNNIAGKNTSTTTTTPQTTQATVKTTPTSSNTMLWVIGAVGALALVVIGYFAMRKS